MKDPKISALVPNKMKLQKEIGSAFGTKHVPNTKQLVVADGFDVFEKERAVEFFSGKSLNDVLAHLQARMFDPLAGGDYQLEEWSVLKPSARYYYMQAYLAFLHETLSSSEPDGGYVSDFFHQLYQTVFMYGSDAYCDKQETLLRNLATYTLKTVQGHEGIDDWSDDIAENINFFLAELEKQP